MPREWFETWFDSPYYHILYAHRDDTEARRLIDNILEKIPFRDNGQVLDIGCGNGRHAQYLSRQGFQVCGIDIAPNNIQRAQKRQIPGATFEVHDMRDPLPAHNYDLALNLFTSFGYFDTEEDNIRALKNFANALRPGGVLVLDYFNAHKVRHNIITEEIQTRSGIDFKLTRKAEGKYVIKQIRFEDQGKAYGFQERVRLLTLDDFTSYFKNAGLNIRYICGDYEMGEYDAEQSPRLILVAEAAIGN